MAIVGGFLYCFGESQEVAFLFALSTVPIGSIAYQFGDGANEPRYWLTLAGLSALHCVAISTMGGDWIPKHFSIVALPIFLLDYVMIAYLFPKLSGLAYEY